MYDNPSRPGLFDFEGPHVDVARDWIGAMGRAHCALAEQQRASAEVALAWQTAQVEALRDAENPLDYVGRQSELASETGRQVLERGRAWVETAAAVQQILWTALWSPLSRSRFDRDPTQP